MVIEPLVLDGSVEAISSSSGSSEAAMSKSRGSSIALSRSSVAMSNGAVACNSNGNGVKVA